MKNVQNVLFKWRFYGGKQNIKIKRFSEIIN